MNPYNQTVQHSMRPIEAQVLNLPVGLRAQWNHIWCLGMICGPSSPSDMQSSLALLVCQLKEWLTVGYRVYDAHLKVEFTSKGMVVATPADTKGMNKIYKRPDVGSKVHACHVCDVVGVWTRELRCTTYGQARRLLPLGHRLRSQNSLGRG